MKNIIIILSIFILSSACKKLEDLNKNIKDPSAVSGESLFTNAQKNLVDQIVSTNVNYNVTRLLVQYWTETTYTDESNYDLVTRQIPDQHWDVLYRDVLKNLDEAKKVITNTTYLDAPEIKTNKLAIVDILSVYTYKVLVESFGNVPYSEALNLDKPLPKYDAGLTIYKDLLTRIDADLLALKGTQSFDAADNFYSGDVNRWIKFANALKLKMGLVLASAFEKSNNADDQALVKSIIESSAVNVFTSNLDNAKLVYLAATPNTNPIYLDLVASGRHDFVPTSTIVDAMNNLNDPRRPLYFTLIDTSTEKEVVKNVYYGGVNGASNDYLAYSHVADAIQKPVFPGTILDYSEVEFSLAEAAARNYAVSGTPESHYTKAIEASILDWGGKPEDVTAYLANPKVAYSTAEGDFKQKIGTQSWIAFYNRGLEAWTQWRRLGYPILTAPADAVSAIPVRYTYPIEEQTLNGENYKAASAAIGSDDVTTKLFFHNK